MSTDTSSKDYFFAQLASLSEAMIAAHGKDFAMGAMVLAARFIAESEARAKAAGEAATEAATGTATGTAQGIANGAVKAPDSSRIISSRVS